MGLSKLCVCVVLTAVKMALMLVVPVILKTTSESDPRSYK